MLKKWQLLALSTFCLWVIMAVVLAVVTKPQDYSLHSEYVRYIVTRGAMLASATLLYAFFTRGRD